MKAVRAEGTAEQVTLTQTWDALGRLVTRTDGNNHPTQYSYDPVNRIQQITYADNTAMVYSYDRDGNLQTYTNPAQSSISFTYDSLGRVLTETHPSDTRTYSYDGLSRLIQARDNDAQVDFEYDSWSRVLSESLKVGDGSPRVTEYAYDDAAHALTVNYPGSNRSLTYRFDELDRIQEIQELGQVVASYQYLGPGRVEQKTNRGIVSAYGYDNLGRVTQINSSVLNQTIGWDAVGNKTARSDSANGRSHTYEYDALDRLIHSTVTNGADGHYEYDDAGNFVQTGYTMVNDDNPVNQYTTTPEDSRLYDDNGNLISLTPDSESARLLAYDGSNQLTAATVGGTVTTYQYDPLGRRVAKTVGGNATYYVFSGDQVLEEWDATGAVQASYVFGNSIDEVLSLRRNGQDYLYHGDNQFNVLALTDPAGSVVETYDYEDFGKPTATSAVGNPYLFNGRPYDPETGFYYYRTRYLDSSIGRFTTRDSIGIWGDPLNLGNGYTYVGNNPGTYIDPWGNAALDPALHSFYTDEEIQNSPVLSCILVFENYLGGKIEGVGEGLKNLAMFPYTLLSGVSSTIGVSMYHEMEFYHHPLSWLEYNSRRAEEWWYNLDLPDAMWQTGKSLARMNARDWGRLAGESAVDVAIPVELGVTFLKRAEKIVPLEFKGFYPPPGTRKIPEGIPDSWRIIPSDEGTGVLYYDPLPGHLNKHRFKEDSVRVMPGDPTSQWPNSRKPYVRWQRKGQSLDINGNKVNKNTPDAHIPLDQFKFKPEIFQK